MARSKSSISIGVAFPPGMFDTLNKLANDSGDSMQWHIRQACLIYLMAKGIDASKWENPTGRGVRSDLKQRLTPEQELQRLKYLISKRKE